MHRLLILTALTFVSCARVLDPSPFASPSGIRALSNSIHTIYILDTDLEVAAYGTAWAISQRHLVTADHVCSAFDQGYSLQVKTKHVAYVFISKYRDAAHDVCVIQSDAPMPFQPLKVRSAPLDAGERIFIYGSPLGVPDMLTQGWTSGYKHVLGGVKRVYSIQAAGGNSGSPVMDETGQVVGVLVAGSTRYNQLTFGTPLYALQRAVRSVP